MIGLWRLVYWASFGAALEVVLAGGVYAGFAYALQAAPFRGAPFDPARWQAVWRCDGLDGAACTLRRADCPRGPMVADLVDSIGSALSGIPAIGINTSRF